ncbi:STAS domain-containing protein [Catenuloplanes atrovinosus]|uniref:Anti-anti-sigma factor n=1 Tax=Catenuloplanes atrovinosus TaxID=137266 RepID=A0AAE3YSH6_9ACTN|nr:STAS domain-containing protein [Catenuloplanes atrovinosus]MDR7277816.1 anti-anti-sigma factor [Catenuloplanes atrovinosus]
MAFGARTSGGPTRTVVTLDGECDLAVREELTATLLAAVAAARTVVVDLLHVTFIDSTGVHSLVTAHHAALAAGGRLHVTNATGPVATVLDLTGVGPLLAEPGDTVG